MPSKFEKQLEELAKYSFGDYNKDDVETVRQFVSDISYVINKKIFALEEAKNITIKLAPLPKKIPARKNNQRFFSMATIGTTTFDTGMHGSFSYPTSVNINPAFAFGPMLFDPLGNSEETIQDRLNKIKKYIKVYNSVQEALVKADNNRDSQYENQYFIFNKNSRNFTNWSGFPTDEQVTEAEKKYKEDKKKKT